MEDFSVLKKIVFPAKASTGISYVGRERRKEKKFLLVFFFG